MNDNRLDGSRHSTDDEKLAIVDEHDRVIGCAARKDIHDRGLRHRSVHVVVSNPNGEIFVQQRSATKDVDPLKWDTAAAGHVDFGESYGDCAVRELEEELGIAGATPELFDTLPASLETGNEFVHVYSVISDQSLRLNREEIADGRWCPVDDLERWINAEPDRFTSAFRLIFERFRAKLIS